MQLRDVEASDNQLSALEGTCFGSRFDMRKLEATWKVDEGSIDLCRQTFGDSAIIPCCFFRQARWPVRAQGASPLPLLLLSIPPFAHV